MRKKSELLPLSNESSVPLYRQLADQLREAVKLKVFNTDEALPKEVELAKMLGVSRSVVRQAILQLVAEGYVYRVPGKGTFLSSPTVEYDLLGFYNFKNEVERQGGKLSIKLISFEKLPVDPINAALFGIDANDRIYDICRLLLVNNAPVLLERTLIPESKVLDITEKDVKESPFLKIFSERGIKLSKAKRYIEPRLADPLESKELQINTGMPVLVIDRFTYGEEDNKVLARCIWTVRGDRCRYYIGLENHTI